MEWINIFLLHIKAKNFYPFSVEIYEEFSYLQISIFSSIISICVKFVKNSGDFLELFSRNFPLLICQIDSFFDVK
jgi:hypothetical protein